MNRMFFVSLLFWGSASSIFSCSCINNRSCEARISQLSLLGLIEDFRSEKVAFQTQAQSTIQELEKIPSDDAVLTSLRLQKDLRIIEMLDYLIVECKDEQSTPPIKQDRHLKLCLKEVCQCLASVMPYAGKMQDVIVSVLKKEFGVDSVNELEAMTGV